MGWLAILFGLLLLAIVVAADTSNLGPFYRVYDFSYGDKVGHFVLFGSLSLLSCLALIRLVPHRSPAQVAVAVAVLIATMAGMEEFSQLWIATRKPDALDLLAGYAGIGAFAFVAVWLQGSHLYTVQRWLGGRVRTDV
jgi:VanZ family protein